MNLDKTNDQIAYYSSKASEISRQLSFGGLAVLWLFIYKEESGPEITSWLALLSAVCFILSIMLDLSHNLFSARAWTNLHQKKEIEVNFKMDQSFTYTADDLKTTNYFYWSKHTLLAIGYLFLGLYVAGFVHLSNPFCNCTPS